MKKTMTPKGLWILFMLVFLNTTLQAQTEQETLKFLQTYYSSIPTKGTTPNYKVEYSGHVINIESCIRHETESGKCEEQVFDFILPFKVSGIEISRRAYKQISKWSKVDEAWIVKISVTEKGATQFMEFVDSYSFSIDPSKDRAYVERFKKALLKLASLKGAKIVDESLFDK